MSLKGLRNSASWILGRILGLTAPEMVLVTRGCDRFGLLGLTAPGMALVARVFCLFG